MNQITVTGMVLQAEPIGEFDRRVVILTKERGKISAFARGARKPNSVLVGVTSPITFGEFLLYEGRTSYTLMSASISNYFGDLKADMESAYYAFYFLEIASYYTREGNDEREMLILLYQTMRALENSKIPNPLVRYIYELKAISINGEAPCVTHCMLCADREREQYFSVKRGGIICKDCRENVYDGKRLQPATLYTLQYVIMTPPQKLYSFVLKDEIFEEFKNVVEEYFATHIDKRFKSLEILEMLMK